MGGLMPHRYMGAILAGQSLGGLGINLIRAASLEICPITEEDTNNNAFKGALFMFLLGAVIMFLCALT